jgi:integrase
MRSRHTPLKIRNGLAWRAGRPRWEPSPANRAVGLKGLDLKRPDGEWMDRGEAIGAADARKQWADQIRMAASGGERGAQAAATLSAVLMRLQPPATPQQAHKREGVADLIERARQLLGEISPAGPRRSAGQRTVAAMVDAYFEAVDAGEVAIAASTRRAYLVQSRRLVAELGDHRVADVSRGQLVTWHRKLIAGGLSPSNANQALGATAAFLTFAAQLEPAWIAASPAVKLGLRAAPGRRVFWTLEEERAFVTWCDLNGRADVADGITAGLWTGARIGDVCRADLADLAGEVWRFTPQKTAGAGQEAMPAIMAPLRARIERRRAQLVTAIDGAFLWDPRTRRRHDTGTFGKRFAEAKALWLREGGGAASFAGKRVQDTRDTCITRLWEAGVPAGKMYAWTGHSQASIEHILREHYVVLREQGSLDMAGQLAAWAEREAVRL